MQGRKWGLWLVAVAGLELLAGCPMGPSEQRLNCLQSCARWKDGCMLEATNAAAIQHCDGEARNCSGTCPP